MKNSYKYFQEGDKIISAKRKIYFRFYRDIIGNRPELHKVYTFRGYVPRRTSGNPDELSEVDYSLMVVKDDGIFYDGHEFITVLEYRKLQLKRLKRKMFFKKIFSR